MSVSFTAYIGMASMCVTVYVFYLCRQSPVTLRQTAQMICLCSSREHLFLSLLPSPFTGLGFRGLYAPLLCLRRGREAPASRRYA